jgi:creatinine amidohydrolase
MAGLRPSLALICLLGADMVEAQPAAKPMRKGYEPEVVRSAVPLEPVPAEVRAQYLRPGEILAIQGAFPVAYQPVGTLEWHGRHNPVGCDAIKAERLCLEVAKRIGGAVMPPIYFSVDAYRDVGKGYGLGMDPAAGFLLPGSFYQIDPGLFRELMLNAVRNYLNRGFKLVVLVSGHNPPIQQNTLDDVCYQMKTPDGREPVYFTMEYTTIEPGNPRRSGDHAGGYETSMMLHLNGDRVNVRANEGTAEPNLAVIELFPVREATAEEGRVRFELQAQGLAKVVRQKLAALQ